MFPYYLDKLFYKGLVLFPRNHECLLNGQPLKLTDTEFSILNILMENKGQIVSIKELATLIWPDEVFIDCKDAIAVHVHHLRKKMNDTQKPYTYIGTARGVGYVMKYCESENKYGE